MLNKEKIRKEFSRHAFEYDQYATLQKELALHLVKEIAVAPEKILELGCGTGFVTLELGKCYPKAEIFATDIAEGMLLEVQKKLIASNINNVIVENQDMEFPRYPEESFDLIISNASLQWANDLAGTFCRVFKLLSPGGYFLGTLYGEQSLFELRNAARVAFGKKYTYEQTFPNKEKVEELLSKAGFKSFVVLSELRERPYPAVKDLLRALKHIGAQNASVDRINRLVTKHELKQLEEYYQKKYLKDTGVVATYEILSIRGKRNDQE